MPTIGAQMRCSSVWLRAATAVSARHLSHSAMLQASIQGQQNQHSSSKNMHGNNSARITLVHDRALNMRYNDGTPHMRGNNRGLNMRGNDRAPITRVGTGSLGGKVSSAFSSAWCFLNVSRLSIFASVGCPLILFWLK